MGISDKELIGRDRIKELIPQREPIIMIDSLVQCDDVKTVSSFTIQRDNIFIRDGKFSEAGIVENIAQTAAARAGYLAMLEQVPVPLGFIAGIRDLRIHFYPEIGSILRTEITIDTVVMGMTIILARSECNGKVVGECEMKIYINPQQD